MVSVYITSYNKEQYLTQAINSVLEQTLPPSEIIIIDDCSSDNSRQIISEFKNSYPDKFKTIYNDQNLGISKTRNIAISACSSDIITFVDADDYFFPYKIESELNRLKNNNCDVVYSNHVFIDQLGVEKNYFADKGDKPAEGDIFIECFTRNFKVRSYSNFHNEMFYKNNAINIGLYDENIIIWEDWDFRIRMSKKYKYGYCPKVNSAYRDIKDGLHNSNGELHYREQIKIYRKNQQFTQNLSTLKRDLIRNKVYTKIKGLFVDILNNNINNKKYYKVLQDCLGFIFLFRQRRSLRLIYKNIFNLFYSFIVL